MKKHVIYIVGAALLLSACVKNNISTKNNNDKYPEVITNMTTTSEYTVPTKSGYTTIVSYKGKTLAVTSSPMDILIPKQALTTKADATDSLIVYYTEGTTSESYSDLWQTIAFEDTKTSSSDLDYNDLIFQAEYVRNGANLKINIHPIALGSVNKISLNLVWYQGSPDNAHYVSVSPNVREELFGDTEAGSIKFINTKRYDRHYDNFTKTIDLGVSDSSDPVYISWYIYTSGSKIFALNSFGAECVDDNGNPYGLVLTDVTGGSSPVISGGAAIRQFGTKAGDSDLEFSDWSEVNNIFTWPDEPQTSDYSGLPELPSYVPYGTSNSYVVSADNNIISPIQNGTVYVLGTLTITSAWANNSAGGNTFYVMPGGTLILPDGIALQNTFIYNFGGTIKTIGSESTQHIFVSNNARLYCSGDLYLGTSGSLIVEGASWGDNSGKAYIGGTLNTKYIKVNGTTAYLYLNCKTGDIVNDTYLTAGGTLFINNYLYTKSLEMDTHTPNSRMFIREGGYAYIPGEYRSYNSTTLVQTVPDSKSSVNYSVFKAGRISLYENENSFEGRFSGYMDVIFDHTNVKNDGFTVSSNIVLNDDSIYLPSNGCNPGYGKPANTSRGLNWFRYPYEGVNIRECYKYDSWINGNWDFTLLDSSKVFDITDNNPAKGSKTGIYNIE
ncbi:MAG: hypothetical protein LKI53_00300 [Bacteroidales bacterium]|jgi:hypothetical protein|nr:hypothetical protein [Bacteroidales bacterium]